MSNLAEEARYLHDSLFSRPIDEKTVDRYVAANLTEANIDRIVEKRLDVEAVEFALRHRNPALTRKIQILCYLVEVRAEYQDDFIATRREPIFKLLWNIPRAGWKRLKGECLVRLYGLL